MERKREVMLYLITAVSFMAFIYLAFGTASKISGSGGKNFMSLSGNAVLELEQNFKAGDKLQGDIMLGKEESNASGLLFLTNEGEPVLTQTFNLKDIPKNKTNSGYSINLEDLVNYTFEEKGKYELFFSVLDLDINIKKEFIVG